MPAGGDAEFLAPAEAGVLAVLGPAFVLDDAVVVLISIPSCEAAIEAETSMPAAVG